MAKKRKVVEVVEVEEKRSGCLKPVLIVFAVLLALAIFSPSDKKDTSKATTTATPTVKATATARPTNTPKPTATPTQKPAATPTEKPTPTPAIPGTYRPGIERTNAYDITVAMKEVGIEPPKRQSVQDGYSWISQTYKEGNVSYNIEIETTTDYRVTNMDIMMSGGNNNFVWWACACMFGEKSEEVTWLKENMWNETTTTKIFNDAVWTINPLNEGVTVRIQHVDAEKWYMSLI